VLLAALLGASVVTAPTSAGATANGSPSSRAKASTAPGPPLESLVLKDTLPRFTLAPYVQLDGPISSTSLGSLVQNSETASATSEIEQLMTNPDSASFVRVWTDNNGIVAAANEVEIAVFELPSAQDAGNLLPSIDPTSGQHTAAVDFAVPSVPAAQGETFDTTDPLLGSVMGEYGTTSDLSFQRTVNIVWFTAGHYVCIVKTLSNGTSANADAPSPAATATLAKTQYERLASSPLGKGFDTLLLVRVLLALAACGIVGLVFVHRRRREVVRAELLASLGLTQSPVGKGSRSPTRMPAIPEGPLVAPIGPAPLARSGKNHSRSDRSPIDIDTLLEKPAQRAISISDLLGISGTAVVSGRPDSPTPPQPPGPADFPKPPEGTPAGWLDDPESQAGKLRYWDGQSWTSFVAVPSK